jgi:hypothetical protein
MIYINKFNDTFIEFIEDLVRIFPDDPEFFMYKIAIQNIINRDNTIIINLFDEHVVIPYGDRMLNKDNELFINNHYISNDRAVEIIKKLQSCWIDISDDDKEIVWKYFKILILLNNKYRNSS